MNEKENNPGQPVLMKQNWGQYRLIGTVEYGRFSKAYLGEHREHPSKQFVVEIFPLTLTPNESTAFLQSGHSLMQLVHPSILRLTDVGVQNATPFIVLDSIAHTPLRRLYLRGQGQPFAKLLPYLRQIASALQHAHTQGHIHKHLCPDNVLLAPNDRVLLCDFAIDGIDKNERFRSYQRRMLSIEPLAYMAPEQIQQQPVYESDQYALATMIYEWLCGTPPFLGSPSAIAQQQVYSTPPSIHKKAPGISPNVEDVVMIALSKETDERFANVAAFMHALEQASALMEPEDLHGSALPAGERVTPPFLNRVPTEPLSPDRSPIASLDFTIPPTPIIAGNNLIDVLANPANARRSITLPFSQSSAPSALPEAQRQQKSRNNTRRAMLISAASVVVIGGIGSWLLWNRWQTVSNSTHDNGNNGTTPTAVPLGQQIVYSAHTARVNAVAWSPDSQKIASASNDKLVLICDRTGNTLLTYAGHTDVVNTVAWSLDGKYIASGGKDQTVQIWDATSGQLISTYSGHSDTINAVAWSSDNSLVASGSDDKTVQAWHALTSSLLLTYRRHTDAISSVAWSPDMLKIASGSLDNTLQVCSTILNEAFAVGQQIFSSGIHGNNAVYALAWSPDGTRIASGGSDNVVLVCNGTDGNLIDGYPPLPHDKLPVRSVAWSPDGNFIVSGGDDKVARVWDAITGKPTHLFANHSNSVLALGWSPDGSLVASGSADKTMQVWKPS